MENIFSNILLFEFVALVIYSIYLYLKNAKYFEKGEGIPTGVLFIFFVGGKIDNVYTQALLLIALISVISQQYKIIELKKKLKERK